MTTVRAMIWFLFPLSLTCSQTAAAAVFDGDAAVDAQIEREHAEVAIYGKAAFAIFWVTAFRMRLEELGVNVRRARGRDVTCYAYGEPTTAMEQSQYACHLSVGEFGAISAPPIPNP